MNELRTLDQQYGLQKQRLAAAHEKYVGDSILYKKDMLSKYEYNNTKDANLALRENLALVQSQKNKQLADRNLAYNDFTKEQNSLLLIKVQLDENTQALIQARDDYESHLIQAKDNLRKLDLELGKQYIISTTSGIVNHLFNTKQTSNLISRADLLISVAPKTVSYYAKVFLSEKDIPYVKAGLNVKLKLDAYQRFKHGPINGKISYVAERKENDKFYALVELSKSQSFLLKSGYKVNGEIVIQRLSLISYFIKKIFNKFDPA